jgi:hypothetical protein
MPEAQYPDIETRLRAEVDRAVAPYARIAPPAVLAKLRELAERYYREQPDASCILRMLEQKQRARSGVEPTAPAGDEDPAAAAARGK